MKPVVYLQKDSQISNLLVNDITEVIIEPMRLSRFGKLSLDQVNMLAEKAANSGMSVAVEWDILMVENSFKEAIIFFNQLNLKNITSVRVQDPGAIHWCLVNTNLQIQLILETGNHNLAGIKSWISLGPDRISRIVLSIEWSKDQLKKLLPNINCPVEFLVMGRILLFYTPRYLLRGALDKDATSLPIGDPKHWIEASGQSEESPHKGFPLIENNHGTFMFLPSDHSLLDHMQELEELGISLTRIDNRFMDSILLQKSLDQIQDPSVERFEEIKALSKNRLIRGFYNTNKSDVLFKKLKNHRIQRKDNSYLGQVLEVNKKNYLAIQLKNPKEELSIGKKLKILTPEGNEKYIDVKFIKNCKGESINHVKNEEIVFINHIGGVSTRAAVYFYEG